MNLKFLLEMLQSKKIAEKTRFKKLHEKLENLNNSNLQFSCVIFYGQVIFNLSRNFDRYPTK